MSEPTRLAYTRDEFAEALGVSLGTVKNLISSGDLAVSYIRSKPMILRAEADRYIASLSGDKRTA